MLESSDEFARNRPIPFAPSDFARAFPGAQLSEGTLRALRLAKEPAGRAKKSR
jgi:hypothetical protein